MATRKEVKNRISSVKNVQKITRAMEMVAAARLRRAEQRIDALRPYARELRKMTRQVAEAFPRRGSPRRVRGFHRSPGVCQRQGDRGRPDRLVRRQGPEPRRSDLQPLRLTPYPV